MISFRILVLIALVPSFVASSRAQDGDCLRRTVLVNAVDKFGAPIVGLTAADFRAELRANPIRIVSVAETVRPGRIVLLLDSSGSMIGETGEKWNLATSLAAHLAQSVLGKHSLALMIFSNKVDETVDFTMGNEVVARRIDTIRNDPTYAKKHVRGQTALTDAILEALALLGPTSEGDAIFVITDGDNNKSRSNSNRVTHALLSAGVRLLVLMLRTWFDIHRRVSPEGMAPEELEDITLLTGGQFESPEEFSSIGNRKSNLTEDERKALSARLAGLYREIKRFYLMEIELARPLDKPRRWKLHSIVENSRGSAATQLSYPHELLPCPKLASPH